MLSRVLVPVDDSETARRALARFETECLPDVRPAPTTRPAPPGGGSWA